MIQNDSPAILWEMHSLLDKAEQNLLFMNRMQQWGQNAPNFHQLFFLDIQLRYNDFTEGHTSYLSFLLHWQDFRKPNFTPKKTTKGTKNTKNVSEKVKYMHFFTQSGKIYT